MRVLVTGADGFVGKHLVSALRARGDRVEACGGPGGAAGFEITDPAAVAVRVEQANPEAVVHLAGVSSVAQSHAHPASTVAVNVSGAMNLLQALREHTPNARILLVGSGEEYGRLEEGERADEDHRLAPVSPYAASKAAVEVLARQCVAAYGLAVILARPFNHLGPGQASTFVMPSFAEQLVRIARNEAPPVISVGDLSPVRDFTHVLDVVDAYLLLLERGEPGEAYNICSGEGSSIQAMLELLQQMAGTAARIHVNPARLRPAENPLAGRQSAPNGIVWLDPSTSVEAGSSRYPRLRGGSLIRPKLGIIFDAVEERWPSMEFVAEMLLQHLRAEHAERYDAQAVRPKFFGLFEAIPGLDSQKAWNVDRLITRFVTYPSELAVKRGAFDLFHVADHSYAQLIHVLPARRTGVYCHDLDAFACLRQPNGDTARWRRGMARAQLAGLQRAAVVFYSTQQIGQQIEEMGFVDPQRLVHAPYGVAPEYFAPDGVDELPAGSLPDRPFLLHVGSSLPRKRLDVLFRAYAEVRRRHPQLVLVQQGAQLLTEQRDLVAELRIDDGLIQPPHLSRRALAALYHRAELVLLTSEREGFGLPLLEALAAGAAVVASDIPAFREVAGNAVTFCPVGDVPLWADTISRLLERPDLRPAAPVRHATAARFTWTEHASIIANAYARVAGFAGLSVARG